MTSFGVLVAVALLCTLQLERVSCGARQDQGPSSSNRRQRPGPEWLQNLWLTGSTAWSGSWVTSLARSLADPWQVEATIKIQKTLMGFRRIPPTLRSPQSQRRRKRSLAEVMATQTEEASGLVC